MRKGVERRGGDLGEGRAEAKLEAGGLGGGEVEMRESAEQEHRGDDEIAVALTRRMADGEQSGRASRRAILSAEEVAKQIVEYRALGVTRLAVDLPNPNLGVLLRQMERLAQATSLVGALDST